MQDTRASVRYAKSLLTLSIEKNVLDEVKADVDMVCKSFDESREISNLYLCLLYTSPSPRDRQKSRMPSSA